MTTKCVVDLFFCQAALKKWVDENVTFYLLDLCPIYSVIWGGLVHTRTIQVFEFSPINESLRTWKGCETAIEFNMDTLHSIT